MPRIPSPDELLEIARQRTGLGELGNPSFEAALTELVSSINDEATLTEDGAPAATERLLRVLVNRLRFEADKREHPGLLEEPLLPPLIICGLRTASIPRRSRVRQPAMPTRALPRRCVFSSGARA